jgi:secreted trypsin-like serine protease
MRPARPRRATGWRPRPPACDSGVRAERAGDCVLNRLGSIARRVAPPRGGSAAGRAAFLAARCGAVAVAVCSATAAASAGDDPLVARIKAQQAAMIETLVGTAAPARPEIIGGSVARKGAWPFVVGLVSASTPSNYAAQFCGGSLIASTWVLTAAHCLKGVRPGEIAVLVGTNDLDRGGRRIAVAEISVHPRYSQRSGDYDVALVRLDRAAGIAPVRLVGPGNEQTVAAAGDKATVIGWGDIDKAPKVTRYPALLHQVSLPIVGRDTCNRAYRGDITERMICAGLADGGKDACQGDSGGPLVVESGGGVVLQAGVVSFGVGCALPKFYGVYSRVAVLKTWIDRVTAGARRR